MYGNMEADSVHLVVLPPLFMAMKYPPSLLQSTQAKHLVNASNIDAVKDFTGADDVKAFITGVDVDPMFGNLPQITDRPTNTMANMRNRIIDSAPTARKAVVADLIGQSEAIVMA